MCPLSTNIFFTILFLFLKAWAVFVIIIFPILVLVKLDKISKALEKKENLKNE